MAPPKQQNRPLSVFEVALLHYVGVGSLVVVALFVYLVGYPSQINDKAKIVLEILVAGYLAVAPFYYFWLARRGSINADAPSRSFIAARFFWRLPWRLVEVVRGLGNGWPVVFPDAATQRAVLAALVKFFFAPLMISFFFANIDGFTSNFYAFTQWIAGQSTLSSPDIIWRKFYLSSLHLLLILDTIIFAFAYLVESDKLGNKIQSVDTTLGGWVSALVCYPPFNFFTRQTFSAIGIFSAPNRSPVMDLPFIVVSQAIALILIAIYVWATVALGSRAGNLVHRGIVASGPYHHIRHPAYASKNLAWFFEFLPFLHSPWQIVSWVLWAGIYVLRAVTEERHLVKDPTYQTYCREVPHRFIPRIV